MRPHVTTELVEMTEPICQCLLGKNTHNRLVRNGIVGRISTDMHTGNWLFNGDTIKVSPDGTLLDGQHRLLAWMVERRPDCWFLIVRGVSVEAQMLMDRHSKRKLNDSLTLALNITVTTRVCAALNVLGRIGDEDQIVMTYPQMTESELADAFMDWSEYHTECERHAGTTVRAGAMAALVQYYRHDKIKGAEFAEQVGKGLGLSKNSPALKLRNYMDTHKHQGSQDNIYLYKHAVSAIAAHRRGDGLNCLKASESWPFKVEKVHRERFGKNMLSRARAAAKKP
jgi:hypothetical protein